MKQQFEAVLSGSDSPVDGIASRLDFDGFADAYEFESTDNSLHLIIAKDEDGKWQRVAGTEPYFRPGLKNLLNKLFN